MAPAFDRTRIAAAKNIVAPLTFEGGAEAGADVRMGTDPNRAIVNEGLVGTKNQIVEQAGKRVSELKTAANGILQNHANADVQIDAAPHIDRAIDKAIGQAEKTAGATERLEKLREALKTKYGAVQGTPLEMNNLASDIQKGAKELGAYKNTQPVEASLAAAMSDAARGIRGEVNKTIPDVASLNHRMADLLDAIHGVTHNIDKERGTSAFAPGMTGRLFEKTVGSAPVRTGMARALNAGNVQDVPTPPAPRIAVPLNRQLPPAPNAPIITPAPTGAGTSNPIPPVVVQSSPPPPPPPPPTLARIPGRQYIEQPGKPIITPASKEEFGTKHEPTRPEAKPLKTKPKPRR